MVSIPGQNIKLMIRQDWCKECGLCVALCPKQVLGVDDVNRIVVVHPDKCIACKTCERICPDFAIDVEVK